MYSDVNVLVVRITADAKVRTGRLKHEAAGAYMSTHVLNHFCEVGR